MFGGRTSTGRTSNHCAAVDVPIQFCDKVAPFLTQLKLNGAYPLPWWGLQGSATFQSLPGIPILATYVPGNAEIAPVLGRNLAACGATVACAAPFTFFAPTGLTATAVNLIEPNKTFEKRLTQLDVRLTKVFQLGRTRIQGMFDIYNILNGSAVLGINPRLGPSFLRPASVQGARLFKFGAQFDF